MFKNLKNKYSVEAIDYINNELIILIKDLELDEYIEITSESLKNKTSKTDKIIHKLVMKKMYNDLINDKIS